MRYPFLIALVFAVILLSGPALAWEESFEGHWEEMSLGSAQGQYSIGGGAVSTALGPHTLYHASSYAGIRVEQPFDGYTRFNFYSTATTINTAISMQDSNNVQRYDLYRNDIQITANEWHVLEIIEIPDTSVTLYIDGVSKATDTIRASGAMHHQWLGITPVGGSIHLDDFSNTPFMMGAIGFISSSSGTIYNTITVPTSDIYHATLSKQTTGEIVHTWDLSGICQIVSFSVGTYYDDDGFYYLDIYDAAGKLYYSKLIYYNSLGVYPTTYFTATTDTAADIRDNANNGGEVIGGGTVYLTPADTVNHYQDFNVEFQEPAYNRELVFTKVFNTSQVTGSIISLTGLNPNVYNVSLDSAYIGSTSGLNSFSHTVDWIGDNSYTLELSPDFSSPGSWGYVVDSSTQEKIPYARLYLSNDSYSQTVYSDENGMYYIAGLTPGAYTIQATKKGYTSSPAQPFTAYAGATTRQDLYLESSGTTSGEGLYYAPHSVTFTVLEFWYNQTGLQDVSYSIEDENNTTIQTGSTDSLGQFAVKSMDENIKYKITLTYNGFTDIEFIYPGLSEYTLILHKNSGVVSTYINSWLTLNYSQNQNNVLINYTSNKSITGGAAALTVKAGNGTQVYTQTLTTDSGSFNFPYSNTTDYILSLNITAGDGSTASQSWVISAVTNIKLFPDSLPQYLKNTLFVAIIILFLLAFGKAKNDVACLCGAALVHMGYYFGWLTCSFNFVILIWIIAIGAAYIHLKRSGAL